MSDSDLFFGAIWQAVLASAHVRLPAVNFLVSQVNKQLPASKQRHIIGDDIDRMVTQMGGKSARFLCVYVFAFCV